MNYGVVRNPDALYYIPYGATGKARIINNTANVLKVNTPGRGGVAPSSASFTSSMGGSSYDPFSQYESYDNYSG